MNNEQVELMGYIKKFAKDCPKPDGWFSCRFRCFSGEEVSLTGKTDYCLSVGVQLVVIAYKEFRNGYENYKAIEIKPDINSRKGLIAYLSSSIFVGIGKVTADKIYDVVGPDFIDIIKTDPDYLKKFGFKDSIINSLIKGVSHNSLYTDLVEKYPCFKPVQYNAIIDKYSSDAISILMENPYRLLYDFNKDGDDVSFDFKSVDKFALYIGSNVDVNIRLENAVRYYVTKEVNDNKGSYIDIADNYVYDKLLNGIYDLLNGSVSIYDIKPFVDNIRNHDNLVLELFYEDGCHAFLFDKTDYKIEKKLADNIKNMLNSESLIEMDDEDIEECIADFEDIHDTVLDDVQKDAVKMALNNRFSVITGGPGRGKTTIIECITFCISLCESFISNKSILLAPTGKAVSKLREVANWFCDEPLTIDRFLLSDCDVNKRRVIIIDEVSMVGFKKMSKLINRFRNCQFILIGDVDQLPSIESGDLLRDLTNNDNIPCTRLVNCYRTSENGGLIIENADKINAGDLSLVYDKSSFIIDIVNDNYKSMDILIDTYNKYITDPNYEISDIAVFCPVNGTAFGTDVLNYKLQNLVNSCGVNIECLEHYYNKKKTYFRVGDRVIQTKNNKDLGIYNGDAGVIIDYDTGSSENETFITVHFDNGSDVVFHRGDYDDLKLAYALSVHKSQGSEYKVVLIYVPDLLYLFNTHADFLSKNMLYTGVTRAKNVVHLIVHSETIGGMIVNKLLKRPTALNYFLNDKI